LKDQIIKEVKSVVIYHLSLKKKQNNTTTKPLTPTRNNKKYPPPPPKDRTFKEVSWLETITFGLYKTKVYIKRK